MRDLQRESRNRRMRRADRHDAALRRHEALALVERDRRQRNRVAEPRERMIAERQSQIATYRYDGGSGAQVVQGDLTAHEPG
jgi:hypothetical protein